MILNPGEKGSHTISRVCRVPGRALLTQGGSILSTAGWLFLVNSLISHPPPQKRFCFLVSNMQMLSTGLCGEFLKGLEIHSHHTVKKMHPFGGRIFVLR